MFRFGILPVAVMVTVAFLPSTALSQKEVNKIPALSTGINVGEKFEGEFGKEHKFPVSWRRKAMPFAVTPGDPNWYTGAIPITLKAGQGISVTATVTGTDRLVGMRVLDPQGKRIKEDDLPPAALKNAQGEPRGDTIVTPKTSDLAIKEVNASGKYTIIVVSNRIGGFTVQATSGSGDDDRKSLEKRLKDLKKEVAEIEAKLKALDEKKN